MGPEPRRRRRRPESDRRARGGGDGPRGGRRRHGQVPRAAGGVRVSALPAVLDLVDPLVRQPRRRPDLANGVLGRRGADRRVELLTRKGRLAGGPFDALQFPPHQARNCCGCRSITHNTVALIASISCARAIRFARSMFSASMRAISYPSAKLIRTSYSQVLRSISLSSVVVNSMSSILDKQGCTVKRLQRASQR